jgi:predicted metal-dependent hydrolase
MDNSAVSKKQLLIINEEKLEYFLKYSRRKSVEIKIKADGQIYVSAPFYVQKKDIEAFLNKKYAWIKNKLVQMVADSGKAMGSLLERKEVPLFGKSVAFEIVESDFKRIRTSFKNDLLRIELPKGFNTADKNILVGEALRKLYISKTKEYVIDRIPYYEKLIGVEAKVVRIKDQSTRWGSCSSKNNLNFNFRLSMMTYEAIDYILVHELCHLKEMNHSKAFWRLVKAFYPECDRAKVWIKENTKKLMFI